MTGNRSKKAAILTSYDGTQFHGWQRQKNEATIQAQIEDTLSKIFQIKCTVHGAGRTDAGVHAIGQVAHFELPEAFELDKLMYSMNSMLQPEIRIIDISEMKSDFHSRFSAKSKTYFYLISRARVLSPFLKDYCCHLPQIGDLKIIAEALKILEGNHDFTRFTAADAFGDSPFRTIFSAKMIEYEDYIFLSFTANGFLRYLVRTLVGTLIKISYNKIDIEEFKNALDGKITHPLPSTLKMPASGLYLLHVDYSDDPFALTKERKNELRGIWPFLQEIELWQLLD